MQFIMRVLVILMLIWGFIVVFNVVLVKEMKNVGVVILFYYYVVENMLCSMFVILDEFVEYFVFIKVNYVVFFLKDIVEVVKYNILLFDNVFVIMFDDGYNNIYENVYFLLKEYGFFYIVFINLLVIGVQFNQLSWDMVKVMYNEGVMFVNYMLDYFYMLEKCDGESEKQWLNWVWQNVMDVEV